LRIAVEIFARPTRVVHCANTRLLLARVYADDSVLPYAPYAQQPHSRKRSRINRQIIIRFTNILNEKTSCDCNSFFIDFSLIFYRFFVDFIAIFCGFYCGFSTLFTAF